MNTLHHKLDLFYNGKSHRAVVFRYCLLTFDIVTISFFIITAMLPTTPLIITIDYMVVLVLIADFLARLWIAPIRRRFLAHPVTIADLVVIGTLLAPAFIENFAFLRVMRALRLLRSYRVLHDLRTHHKFFKRNEEVIQSSINLSVFIFVVTALVYVMQGHRNPEISNYIDALYFTVATLTTTGFGDITMHGTLGRLLAVAIMIIGFSLFLRLAQTVFRPQKVRYRCHTCGLKRHDHDAVHCKHCGEVINIETEGE